MAEPVQRLPQILRPRFTGDEDKSFVGKILECCLERLKDPYKEMELFAEVQRRQNEDRAAFPRRDGNSAYNHYPHVAGYVRGYQASSLNILGLALLAYYNHVVVPQELKDKLRDEHEIVVGDTISGDDYKLIKAIVVGGEKFANQAEISRWALMAEDHAAQ